MALSAARLASAQTAYDLLLKGGHVIDGRSGNDAVRDVAVKNGKIAAVAASIPSTQAMGRGSGVCRGVGGRRIRRSLELAVPRPQPLVLR